MKKKLILIILLLIIIIISSSIGVKVLLDNKNNQKLYNDKNSLIGTFLYEENRTKYVFEEDGTGSMSSDGFKYDYTQKGDGNMLKIDFLEDEVYDVVYSFELEDGTLKLISKEGTVSIDEEYLLKKVKK